MPTRTAIYARQSNTTEGSQSLAIQVDACRQAAERFGLTVVAELVEPPSTSAYKNRGRSRTKYNELLDLIDDGVIDSVTVYKTDRLSRGGGVGWAPLLEAIEAAGLDTNKFILTENGWLSEFELGIRATMDREEAAKTAGRMRDVRRREAEAGKPRPGRARGYGYEKDCLTVRDSEAEAIREAVRRILCGESAYSIVQDWNRRGVPTVLGGPWKTTVLKAMLREPRIAGLRSHYGEVVAVGVWPAIISAEEHTQLVAVLAPRPNAPRKSAPRTFPLVGFLYCDKCGAKLRSLVKQGGHRAYACRKGDGLGGCGGTVTKAAWIEEAVRDYVVAVLTDPETRTRIIAALPDTGDERRERLLAELRELDTRRSRLTDLAVAGALSTTEVKRKNAELDDEVSQVERQLADLPAAGVVAGLPTTYEELLAAWSSRGIEYQRTLISIVINRITVQPRTHRKRRPDPDRFRWDLRA